MYVCPCVLSYEKKKRGASLSKCRTVLNMYDSCFRNDNLNAKICTLLRSVCRHKQDIYCTIHY